MLLEAELWLGLCQIQGQYNQEAWDALDFIVSEAKKRSLRLVIALADNWYGCRRVLLKR